MEKSLLRFTRNDQATGTVAQIDMQSPANYSPLPYMLGSFFEPIGHATLGGVPAELLVNPTFARNPNLSDQQLRQLRGNGEALTRLYMTGAQQDGLNNSGWTPQIMPTGFGLAVLDDHSRDGLPLGWSPLGYPGAASASLGRVGEAVRLKGGSWSNSDDVRWLGVDDGPAGVRQGVFLPIRRCRDYYGDLWVRMATTNPDDNGEIEVGFRRRITLPSGNKQAGENLASVRLKVPGKEWVDLAFELGLAENQVAYGEPVDFYIRWIPRSNLEAHLLVDRAVLFPADADEGLDPDIVRLSTEWPVPLLRWPGGNFVSFHHWRDAVGPVDLRPTYPNYAWGGLEYHLFGTDEFITFCRKIGAEPHITVNSGTGSPEEAAAWVEYCNGDGTTPMGRLRTEYGHPEPYNVKWWEVGNENFGSWQGGRHGSDENARRFRIFAEAMRAASPIPIQLIACGNGFDFAPGGPGYDYVTADGRWHEQLLKQAPDDINYISLHSMPANDLFLDGLTDEEATYAVLGQVTSWENRYLPELLEACDTITLQRGRGPIHLAITEWGNVGNHLGRLHVENYGGVIYGGLFLNLLIRNAGRIPIANTTGFMHGGCLRKAFGIPYYDPQYLLIQQYAGFVGATPLTCHLTGPGFDVPQPADLGAPETDVPFIDLVACKLSTTDQDKLILAVVNKHQTCRMPLEISIPGFTIPETVSVSQLAYPDFIARASPAWPDRFQVVTYTQQPSSNGNISLELPPFSLMWIWL